MVLAPRATVAPASLAIPSSTLPDSMATQQHLATKGTSAGNRTIRSFDYGKGMLRPRSPLVQN